MKTCFALLFSVCALTGFGQDKKPDQGALFWAELKTLCGKAFAGTLENAPAGDTTFKDKSIVAHFRQCKTNEIKVPLVVGGDRSRTWVLTRIGDRIRLKHDHRHEDGKPDEVTNYGGIATNNGLSSVQIFPADEETAAIIPAAASNVWWIEMVAGKSFSYNLRRIGTDRFFKISFDLKTAVPAPEAPWGWSIK